LEVVHFDHAPGALSVLYQGIDLERLIRMLGEQVLNPEVVKELTLCETQNLESLHPRDEPPPYP